MAVKAQRTVAALFEACMDDIRVLPPRAQQRVAELEQGDGLNGRARAVSDYIAGMTDRYAISMRDRLFGEGGAG